MKKHATAISSSALLFAFTLSACNCDGGGIAKQNGRLAADPMVVDFGSAVIGTPVTHTLILRNSGSGAVEIMSAALSNMREMQIAGDAPERVAASSSAMLDLTFTPGREGDYREQLTIANDSLVPSLVVELRGTGVAGPPPPASCSLFVSPMMIDLSAVPVGEMHQETVTVTNSSGGSCTIDQLIVTGPSASQFQIASPSAPLTVAPSSSIQIDLRMRLADPSGVQAALEVHSNDAAAPTQVVTLTARPAGAGMCVTPRMIHFGATIGSANQAVTITACGDHPIQIEALDWTTVDPQLTLGRPPALPFTLAAGASQTVGIVYTPAANVGAHAVLVVRSNDSIVPSLDVDVTGTKDIVPPATGRYLYYWQVSGIDPNTISEIMRLPLQGTSTPQAYWGQTSGTPGCPGCHSVSPDGRYVAMVEASLDSDTVYVVDSMSNTQINLPAEFANGIWFSWRPDVNSQPSYQFAVSAGGKILLGSLSSGFLGELPGANDPSTSQEMPAWGPNGQIAFVRGMSDGVYGVDGPSDIMVISERGGTPAPLPGASQNSMSNYYPTYSPNGTWLAFTRSPSAVTSFSATDAEINLVRTDGSGAIAPLNQINAGGAATSFPKWSVDGTYLSFSSNRPGGAGDWDIYLAPVDQNTGLDSTPVNVRSANTPGFEHGAQWSR